jgi:hybrid cluster-associated redox disulfide protein
MKTKKKINKDMLILDLVENYPGLVSVLVEKYGFHCVGCQMAASESLGEGAKVHGMNAKEVGEMIKDLQIQAKADGKQD